MLSDFGVSLYKLVLQGSVVLALNVWATLRVTSALSKEQGRLGWLLLIWLVPIIGAIAAIAAVRRT